MKTANDYLDYKFGHDVPEARKAELREEFARRDNEIAIVDRMYAELTEKESILLRAFHKGMDRENEGWLHEMEPAELESASIPGIISSLVKKKVIRSETSASFGYPPGMFWIEVLDGWKWPTDY